MTDRTTIANHAKRLALVDEAIEVRDRCIAAANDLIAASKEWDKVRGAFPFETSTRSLKGLHDFPDNPFEQAVDSLKGVMQGVRALPLQMMTPAPWPLLKPGEEIVGDDEGARIPCSTYPLLWEQIQARIDAYYTEMEQAQ